MCRRIYREPRRDAQGWRTAGSILPVGAGSDDQSRKPGETPMTRSVCLVTPARNAARTIGRCLECAVAILERGDLQRIIVVDDGSTDGTAEIAEKFPVTCIRSEAGGRSSARNRGWQAAEEEIIWFVDADCEAEPDALAELLPCFNDPQVGGAGGSYKLLEGRGLLYRLVHEEIIERHRRMPNRVNFLGTFNAAYRRSVLETFGGFDPSLARAQDADLSYRVCGAGYRLGFCAASRVAHNNYTTWWPYLRAQAQQGYWRVWLHLRHTSHAAGDSYSDAFDHVQPPLAMLLLASLPLLIPPPTRFLAPSVGIALALVQVPMTVRLVRRTKRLAYLCFAAMSFVRAFARGLGLAWAVLAYLPSRLTGRHQAREKNSRP
jgi:cellulose synthase/poly-beta-1,6-N-acetylglucosamine synthase-like glycosyltransferase